MKNLITLSLTVLILGIVHGLTAYFLNLNFVDLAIPFGLIAIFLAYIFTNKGGALNRQMDKRIQGETGIRMATTQLITTHSFVFIGTIVYFSLALFITFYFYRNYFI